MRRSGSWAPGFWSAAAWLLWSLPSGAATLAPPVPTAPAGIGVALVAAAAATLGASMLFLWWRRRESLQAWFGLGLLTWSLVLAMPWYVTGLADAVAARVLSTTLNGVVVVLLLLSFLRLAGTVLATPWHQRLLLAIACAAVIGTAMADDPDITRLQPYAGLVLALLLSCMVVDRILQAGQALETANAELRQRVDAQSAELRGALDQMRLSRDSARAADQAKTRFLAAASHDLRQPAHALGLYMAALRSTPLTSDQHEIAERMSAALAALESMFAALLDVSRIDAGGVLPRWDLVPLAPLLRRLADEWAPQAEARGLRLSLRTAAVDAVTVSDAVLLERVLRNLLANAVKYTPTGGVLLACRSRRQPGGEQAWRIEVWDTGDGIAAADHEQVFEEFVQVGRPGREGREARRAPVSGLGLGLAIVRRLVRLLQVRLELRSVPGRGSVFMIDGLLVAGRVPLEAAASRERMRSLAGTLVVVMEDDAEVREATRRLLRLWDCQVVAGCDADEVLRQLQQPGSAGGVPQAIVADVCLAGGRRGPDEARQLRAAWGCQVPLLLVSGEADPEGLRQLQAQGHTCLIKPASAARLRAWLEQAVKAPMTETP